MSISFSHIVACSISNIIGIAGDLPWTLHEDFQYFKDKTKEHIIIMGRKTFESLPNKKALPNRLNIVITRNPDYKPKGAVVFTTIPEALEYAKGQVGTGEGQWPEEIFIIGGGEIYSQTLKHVKKIYLTLIYKDFNGDTKYPDFSMEEFDLISESLRDDPIKFAFMVYERKA